MRNNSIEAPQ